MNNIKRTLIFYLTFIGCCSLLAQDAVVKGRVVDTHSSEVIPEVTVEIKASNLINITDTEGLFNIIAADLPLGEQILLVTMLIIKILLVKLLLI